MGKPKRNILFTFDYELYLGVRSGTVNECLIIPTNRLLAILLKYNIKAIFFVDTTYLIRLEEEKVLDTQAKDDWLKIINQLQSISRQGHDIFPHLHPHWLDAVYNKEIRQWDLSNFSKYRFNALTVEERDYIWEQSNRILGNIIHPLNTTYRFDGYRAGGWSIQPFSDFKPYFEKYGIRYEFSVKPGYKLLSTAHQYDFLNAPQKSMYAFEEDVVVENSIGSYTQYTISSIKKLGGIYKLIDKIIYRVLLLFGLKGYGNGVTVASKEIQNEAKGLYYEQLEMVSIESMSLVKLPVYLNFIRRNNYMHFLSHPKMTDEYQLFCLNSFLKCVTAFCSFNTDFRKISNND